jgi:LmbE family N-acetylglucosaminyl deacetylase
MRSPADERVAEVGDPRPLLHRIQESVDGAVGSLTPRAVRLFARDRSDELTSGRLLVLAPHPDDETLGCGVAVQRTLDAGGKVVVVVATDGRFGDAEVVPPERMAAMRRDEFLEATSALGLDPADLVMLGFEDASLTRSESRLRGAVEDVVAGFRPDVVMSPCPWDIHPDHAALGRVARAVLDGRPVQHVEYLIWGWNQPVRLAARLGRRLRGLRDDRTTAGRPVLVNGTGHVAKKAEALACYTTQFAPSAELYGHSIGGSGPLGNEFLRQIDFENELFFPRRAHKAAAPVEGRSPG